MVPMYSTGMFRLCCGGKGAPRPSPARPLVIGGRTFHRAAVERVFGTKSGARLVRLLPGEETRRGLSAMLRVIALPYCSLPLLPPHRRYAP